MSTQPGKGKGRSGGTGKSSGSSSGSSGSSAGAKKTVPAAKPGRDEATVEITPVQPAAEETKVDQAKPVDGKPAAAKAADSKPKDPEQTRVDLKVDSDGPKASGTGKPGSGAGKPSSGTSKPGESSELGSPGKPAASPVIPPVKDTPADSSWGRTPEPAGGRDKPFGRREVAGSGPAPSSPVPGGPAPAGSGFAGTALKDRPAQTSATPSGGTKVANAKAARKAQLQLARLEPWSVMKFSFVMSLVCFVVLLVAVVVLYMILSGLGVFDSISGTIDELTRDPSKNGGLDAGDWFSFSRIFGYTVLVGALNVLLITALSTVGSVIYNLAADLVGGVEVTLKEAE
ncbi:DUF3566 domain-containing protein [Spirillospora sp. NPDC048911]|uniref:DUF3566 domain-containing protein n=1 Tax=Spirillospora sp. NPDC048911 TaxID=3364527 RepID=UPI00371694E6